MLAGALCEGAKAVAYSEEAPALLARLGLRPCSVGNLCASAFQRVLGSYLLHGVAFFFLLCYRPFGIQFHVETSLFSIYFAKLDRGSSEAGEVGRAGRPTGPGEILRREDVRGLHLEAHAGLLLLRRLRPLFGPVSRQCRRAGRSPRGSSPSRRATTASRTIRCSASRQRRRRLIGGIYSEDEIWSCTTCGACEEECPLLVEYIDKIVDLRRGWWTRECAAVAAEAAEGAREPRQPLRQDWRRSAPSGPNGSVPQPATSI